MLKSEEIGAGRAGESLLSSESDNSSSKNSDSDGDSEDSTDSKRSNTYSQPSTDMLKDARRLFPWQGE